MDIKYAWTDASSHSSLPFLLPSLSLSPSPCFYHFPVFYSRRRFSLCIHIPPLPRLVPALLGPAGSLSFFSRRAISSQRVARSARVHVLSLESAGQTGARHSTDTCITTPKGGNLTSRGQHLLPPFVSSNLILKPFSLSLFFSHPPSSINFVSRPIIGSRQRLYPFFFCETVHVTFSFRENGRIK